ncbi:eamA-like transporter family protein [Klebsiella pneumoniae]|nr:eamA-like transporter family protein [Klebsiella pneumoniae]
MGSSKKGMLNVLIAAVLWGSSGVCAQFIMQESQMSSPFLTMTRLLFAGLILLMLGFVHGDRILLWSSFFGHADQMVGLCTGGQLGGRAGQRFVLCG